MYYEMYNYGPRDMRRQNRSYDYNRPQYKGNELLGIWIPWMLFILFVGAQIPWKTFKERSKEAAKQQTQIIQDFTMQRQHELTSMLAAKFERAKQLGKTYTPQIYANDCFELRKLSYEVPIDFEEIINHRIKALHSLCLEHYQPHVIGRAVTMKNGENPLIGKEVAIAGLRWLGKEYFLFIPMALLIILFKLAGLAQKSSSGREEFIGELIYNWKSVGLATIFWPAGLLFYPEGLEALWNERDSRVRRAEWQKGEQQGDPLWTRGLLSEAERQTIRAEVLTPVEAVEAWIGFVVSLFRLEPVTWKRPVWSLQRMGATGFMIIAGAVMIMAGDMGIARADSFTVIHTIKPDGGRPTTCLRYVWAGEGGKTGQLNADDDAGWLRLSFGRKTAPGQTLLLETQGPIKDGWEPADVRLKWSDFEGRDGTPDQFLLISPRYNWQGEGLQAFLLGNWTWPWEDMRIGISLSNFLAHNKKPCCKAGPVVKRQIGNLATTVYWYLPVSGAVSQEIQLWATVLVK